MYLDRIQYSEYEDKPNSWFLEETQLENINLIVGLNAAGKTRTISVIAGLANIISGIQAALFDSGTYSAEFIDDKDIIRYSLVFKNKEIVNESLSINNILMVDRAEDGGCKIFAKQLNTLMEIKIPSNQIVAVVRRDEIQHPYLERLYNWAAGISYFQFGKPMGQDSGLVLSDENNITVNVRDNNQVAAMLLKGIKDYGIGFKNEIVNSMAIVGYQINEVGVAPNPNISILAPGARPVYFVFVVESDRENFTFQNEMSQGMFRVLSLLIQIIYTDHVKKSSLILIDDIGEGLDYKRSTQLIDLLIKRSLKNSLQIIMSTNDKFVMNNVALKYWHVIKRDKNKCKIYNYNNSQDIFTDFEFTGLSNFDFLSTKFYEKGFEK
jgi:energy-coupling factor transporter ATP-binding protein EcfA2